MELGNEWAYLLMTVALGLLIVLAVRVYQDVDQHADDQTGRDARRVVFWTFAFWPIALYLWRQARRQAVGRAAQQVE